MAAVDERKVREGDEFMRNGEKSLKGGWFSKPDYDGASVVLEKAATCYKIARAWRKAVEANKRAAFAHARNGIMFSAAKCMETAGAICHDQLKDDASAVECFRAASQHFLANDTAEKAAESLVRAAKVMESTPEGRAVAIQLYQDALDIYDENDKLLYSMPTFKASVACAVKAGDWSNAIDLLNRQITAMPKLERMNDLNKAFLSLIIVHLQRGDYVAASKAFQDCCGKYELFIRSDEGQGAVALLDAWEAADQDAVSAVTNSQTFNYLDNEVTRVARKLTVSSEFAVVPGTIAPRRPFVDAVSTSSSSAASTSAQKKPVVAPIVPVDQPKPITPIVTQPAPAPAPAPAVAEPVPAAAEEKKQEEEEPSVAAAPTEVPSSPSPTVTDSLIPHTQPAPAKAPVASEEEGDSII